MKSVEVGVYHCENDICYFLPQLRKENNYLQRFAISFILYKISKINLRVKEVQRRQYII